MTNGQIVIAGALATIVLKIARPLVTRFTGIAL